jgi:hypothetical protein
MKKIIFNLLLVLFALQAAGAQSNDARFALKISFFTAGRLNPQFRKLRVIETNISEEQYSEDGCYEYRGVFNISVEHNGVPLQERDADARKTREEKAKHAWCKEMTLVMKPGASHERFLDLAYDFPVESPGTYEVTVSRSTDVEHPEKGVIVKSNTISFVVPEPTTQEEHGK